MAWVVIAHLLAEPGTWHARCQINGGDLPVLGASICSAREDGRHVAGVRMIAVAPVLSRPRSGLQVAFLVTLAAWAIGERVLGVTHRARRGGPRSRDGGTVWLVAGGLIAGFVAGFALAGVAALDLPAPTAWLALGLVVAWLGMLLRLWAVRTLGPLFTTTVTVQPGHRVITGGPYRLVRHPSYLG